MNFEKLNENNFLLFAVKVYDNPSCSGVEDFNDDVKQFSSVKRSIKISIKKIENNKPDKSLRNVINKIVILNNLFGYINNQRLLYFYIEEKYHSFIYTIYNFLNIVNEPVQEMSKDAVILKHILKSIEEEIHG